jgi:hypothetical protein
VAGEAHALFDARWADLEGSEASFRTEKGTADPSGPARA